MSKKKETIPRNHVLSYTTTYILGKILHGGRSPQISLDPPLFHEAALFQVKGSATALYQIFVKGLSTRSQYGFGLIADTVVLHGKRNVGTKLHHFLTSIILIVVVFFATAGSNSAEDKTKK
jgi:hypothetical protein